MSLNSSPPTTNPPLFLIAQKKTDLSDFIQSNQNHPMNAELLHDTAPVHSLDPDNWFLNHGDYLTQVARKKLPASAPIEDLVQDAFLSAWKGRNGFKGKASERTWLTRILFNRIADWYRANHRKPSIALSQLRSEDTDSDELLDVLHRNQQSGEDQNSPINHLDQSETMNLILQCLKNLPDQTAEAFRLRELQGLSTEEIAERLNITPTHLWVIIHRARKSLRQQLERLIDNALEPIAGPALIG